MDEINTFFSAMGDFVLGAAGHPWVYVVVLLGCIIDGFFPPIPSETVVVGLAYLVVTQGIPNPFILILAATLGAFIGDNVAFGIGRRAGGSRLAWVRGPRMQGSLGRVGWELNRRGASMILAARFLPVGRVAVNVAAGATGYPRQRFAGVAAVSATLWACYTVGIGALAGTWFRENHLLGMGAAIAFAILLGLGLDWIGGRVRAASSPLNDPAADSPVHDRTFPGADRDYEAAGVGSLGRTRP